MADEIKNLSDLEQFKGSVTVFKGKEASTPRQPQVAPQPMRGDDLIKETEESMRIGELEQKEIELFQDSQNLLMQIADQDPDFYMREIDPHLAAKQGWDQAKFIIDKADGIKIEALKRSHPDMFSSPAAALQAFGNSATFQQLTRLQAAGMAAMGTETMSGEPSSMKQHLYELSEWARLLEKAHPGSDMTGEIIGYLTSGPAALFKGWSKLGGAGAKAVMEKLFSNPKIMESMAGKMAVSAAENGAGMAALGAMEGALGTGDQKPFAFDRTFQRAEEMGKMGLAAGAAMPPLMKYAPFETIGGMTGLTVGTGYGAPGAGAAIGAAAGTAVRAGLAANKYAPAVLARLSGGDLKAMRMYNKHGKELTDFAGTMPDHQAAFLDFVFSDAVRQLPERAQADALLPVLPSVDARPLLKFLEAKIKNPTKEQAAVMAELADRAKWVRGQIKLYKGKDSQVSAEGMRSITDGLQEIARSYYGKVNEAVPDWAPQLKDAARIGRLAIVDQAKAFGGKNGQRYVALMEKAAEKMETLKIVTDKFGKDTRFYPERIKAYVNGMFGKNGEIQHGRMKSLDEAWGTNFADNFEKAHYADRIGEMGPSPLNEVATGAYTKGMTIGGTIGTTVGGLAGAGLGGLVGQPALGAKIMGSAGGAAGVAIGAAASSPKVASYLIGVSDRISGVLNNIAAKPEILSRVQANKNSPPEVKKMAKVLQLTLEKDGPMSMGSAMRVMADTPLFMGLVHYMDLNTTAQEKQALMSGLQRQQLQQQSQQNQTARAPQGMAGQQQQQRPPVGQGKFY